MTAGLDAIGLYATHGTRIAGASTAVDEPEAGRFRRRSEKRTCPRAANPVAKKPVSIL